MNQPTQQKQNKKNSGAGWGLLVLLIPLLMRVKDGDLPPVVFFAIAVIVVVAVLVSLAKKKGAPAAKTGASPSPAASAVRKTPSVELHRPAPAMQRREAPISSPNHFPKPDAYCVTCENTGEDHFVRDRRRRIEQLDNWLKNGLIDRQEYLVLKARFEKDQ